MSRNSKTITLTQEEFDTLTSILKFFIYQPIPFYKGSSSEVKVIENILFKKMKIPEFCLIRNQYIDHDQSSNNS